MARKHRTVPRAERLERVMRELRDPHTTEERREQAANEAIGLGEDFQFVCDEASSGSRKRKEMIERAAALRK